MCIETGQSYPSCADASCDLGVSRETIYSSAWAHERGFVREGAGLHWMFSDDDTFVEIPERRRPATRMRIEDVTTGRVFEDAYSAVESVVNATVTRQAVSQFARRVRAGKTRYHGHEFRILEGR